MVGILVLLYFYQNRSEGRYAVRGSDAYFGNVAGLFCIYLDAGFTLAYWRFGTALSYKLIKIEVWKDILYVEVIVVVI